MADQLISVSDACAIYRKSIRVNDRPYAKEIAMLNNKLIDEWGEQLLRKLADANGEMPAGLISAGPGTLPLIDLYRHGIEIKRMWDDFMSEELFPIIPSETVSYWKNFFETSDVATLHHYGPNYVEWGWNILEIYTARWLIEQKHEYIFGDSDEPTDWYRASGRYKQLAVNWVHPLWSIEQIRDISERVKYVILLHIKPDATPIPDKPTVEQAIKPFLRPLTPNDKPYYHIVTQLNNDLVHQCAEQLLKPLTDENGRIDSAVVSPAMALFRQGVEMRRTWDLINDGIAFPRIPLTTAEKWRDFFATSSLAELHSCGIDYVNAGWSILGMYIRRYVVDEKYAKIFGVSENPVQWHHQAAANRELALNKVHPFWTYDEIKNVSEKVAYIVASQIKPGTFTIDR